MGRDWIVPKEFKDRVKTYLREKGIKFETSECFDHDICFSAWNMTRDQMIAAHNFIVLNKLGYAIWI